MTKYPLKPQTQQKCKMIVKHCNTTDNFKGKMGHHFHEHVRSAWGIFQFHFNGEFVIYILIEIFFHFHWNWKFFIYSLRFNLFPFTFYCEFIYIYILIDVLFSILIGKFSILMENWAQNKCKKWGSLLSRGLPADPGGGK